MRSASFQWRPTTSAPAISSVGSGALGFRGKRVFATHEQIERVRGTGHLVCASPEGNRRLHIKSRHLLEHLFCVMQPCSCDVEDVLVLRRDRQVHTKRSQSAQSYDPRNDGRIARVA